MHKNMKKNKPAYKINFRKKEAPIDFKKLEEIAARIVKYYEEGCDKKHKHTNSLNNDILQYGCSNR